MTQEAGTPPDFWRRIQQMIDAGVAKAMRSGALRNASIGSGGITVRGGFLRVNAPDSEVSSFAVSRLVSQTTGAYIGTGVIVQQPDGTDIAVFRTAEGDFGVGRSLSEIRDSDGRIVFATDAASGQGLARPYVGGTFYRQRFIDWEVATSATSFEGLWKSEIVKQHPRLSVAVQVSASDAATTGEVEVLVDGVRWEAVQTAGYALAVKLFGPAPVPGDHMKVLTVEIRGRVTAGTGVLKVEPLHLLGRQS